MNVSDVYAQLDYLASELTKVEERMIDPREFGRLEGAVDRLKTELNEVKQQQTAMDEKLDLVLNKLSEAKGGWKLLMALGGAAATLGAAVAWAVGHNITVAPK